jgi:hypothetical protein
MPHVQLSHPQDGVPKLIVDGVDITNMVQSNGFGIEWNTIYPGRFMVTLNLIPTALDVDLPDCLVKIRRDLPGPV